MFNTFPDTGSATTLIASDLAKKYRLQSIYPSITKYISINGDPVPTEGTAKVCLRTSNCSVSSNAVLSPAIKNEVIIRREDLKELGVIPKQFPAPIYIVNEEIYSSMRESLINNNPDVLTDELPKNSMDTGCIFMKIQLTTGDKKPFRISTARQVPLHW